MGYSKETAKGVSWIGGYRLLTRIVSFARIAILARLLTPLEFGVFGIASLVLTFLETLSQTGVSVFLIQEREKLEKYLNSAYVISVVRGFVLFSIIFWSAAELADFFNSQESVGLMRIVALVALIRGFINPARVRFIKELHFEKEVGISVAVFLSDTLITIILAWWLKSPTALVLGLLTGALVEMILSHKWIKPTPKFVYDKIQIREILAKGKWVTGSSIFSYFFEQGDQMFVGKLLGAGSLGIYQAAYKIAILPITEVVKVFNQVTFPIYTNISGDTKRLGKAFLKTSFIISLLVFPIGLIIFLFSYEVTYFILGPGWLAVVPVLKVLSVFGVIRALIVSTNPLFNSVKKQKFTAKIALISVIALIFTIAPLTMRFGLLGAGYSVIFSSLVSLPLIYLYLNLLFRKLD